MIFLILYEYIHKAGRFYPRISTSFRPRRRIARTLLDKHKRKTNMRILLKKKGTRGKIPSNCSEKNEIFFFVCMISGCKGKKSSFEQMKYT